MVQLARRNARGLDFRVAAVAIVPRREPPPMKRLRRAAVDDAGDGRCGIAVLGFAGFPGRDCRGRTDQERAGGSGIAMCRKNRRGRFEPSRSGPCFQPEWPARLAVRPGRSRRRESGEDGRLEFRSRLVPSLCRGDFLGQLEMAGRTGGRTGKVIMDDDVARAVQARKGSPFLSTEQAGFYLGLSARRMQAMRAQGSGPRFRRHSRYIRYHIDDLDRWSEGTGGGQHHD